MMTVMIHDVSATQLLTEDNAETFNNSSSTNNYKNFHSGIRLARLEIDYPIDAISTIKKVNSIKPDLLKKHVHSERPGNLKEKVKKYQEGKYLTPLALLSTILSLFHSDTVSEKWDVYKSKSYSDAKPVTQLGDPVSDSSFEGGERYGSKWTSDTEDKSVSEKTFIAAVPYVNLAFLRQEQPTPNSSIIEEEAENNVAFLPALIGDDGYGVAMSVDW